MKPYEFINWMIEDPNLTGDLDKYRTVTIGFAQDLMLRYLGERGWKESPVKAEDILLQVTYSISDATLELIIRPHEDIYPTDEDYKTIVHGPLPVEALEEQTGARMLLDIVEETYQRLKDNKQELYSTMNVPSPSLDN